MRVILTADVKNIGQKGDEKEVRPGFARNFLLPRGLALAADSPQARAIILAGEKDQQEKIKESEKIKKSIKKDQIVSVNFLRKARGKKLFGSVKPAEIISSIERIVGSKPTKIKPGSAIKEIGSYRINAEFADGQNLKAVITIKAEK